jgi:cytochrome c oxidase subunit 4
MNPSTFPTMPESPGHAEAALAHVVPVRILLTVFASLIVLTAITVTVSYFDLGALNLLVAMGVATAKASLITLFFMHLRYDSTFNAVIFVIGVAFLALFLIITMYDAIGYQAQVQAYQQAVP